MKEQEPGQPSVAQPAPGPAGPAGPALDGLVLGDLADRARSGRDPRAERRLLALQRSAGNAAIARLLREVAPPESAPSAAESHFVVDDEGPEPGPGAERKTPFLDRVEAAVTAVAEQRLDPLLFRVSGCPWIEHWLGYYRTRTASEVEAAARRYAPDVRTATTAADFVTAIAARVDQGLAAWRETGEIPSTPEPPADAPPGPSAPATLARTPADPEAAGALAELGPGRPLDAGTRGRMEDALGAGLDGVRVHADATGARVASRLGAPALAVGRHVAFADGRYAPGTPVGDAMLAHELAHVLQQDGAPSAGGEREFEGDADAAAVGAVARLWTGARLARARTGPALRSGLRVQRCGGTDVDRGVHGRAPNTTTQTYAAGDVPGEAPAVAQAGTTSTFRFDGDGDQHKELSASLRPVDAWPDGSTRNVHLELTQVASQQSRATDFGLPALADGGGPLRPAVTGVTDGRDPTEVSLVPAPADQRLQIGPGRHDGGADSYALRLDGVTAAQSASTALSTLAFPPDTAAPRSVFSTGEADQPFQPGAGAARGIRTGAIWTLDVTVGAYGDRFRLSATKADPNAAATVLGFSVLSEGNALAGERIDLDVQGPLQLAMLRDDPVHLALDLNGDGQAEVNVYDRLTQAPEGGPAVTNRDHRITFEGPALRGRRELFFPVRDGQIRAGDRHPAETNEQAASQAHAVGGLQQQAELRTAEDELARIDATLIQLRTLARDENLISRELYTAWERLAFTMTILGPSIQADAVSPTLKQQASEQLTAFYHLLARETESGDRMDEPESAGEVHGRNPYTGGNVVRGGGMRIHEAPMRLIFALRDNNWPGVTGEYRRLVDGLDRWISARNRERYGFPDRHRPESLRASVGEQYAGQRRNLGTIEGRGRTRVRAVIHLTDDFEREGQITEAPLSLYYWRDGNTWRLTDLTRADETPTWTHEATSEEEQQPPPALFAKLDENAHFPPGIIHYVLPDGTGGQVRTTGPSTLRQVFTALAIAGAVIGLAMLPGGGRIAVAGAHVLAASSLIGAGMATADLVDRWRHDNMRGDAVLLDAMDIITAFAGLGALRAGRILTGVREAAAAGAPLQASRAIGWANRWYLPLRATEVGASVVTVAVIDNQLMEAMEQLRNSPGDDRSRQRAFLQLFIQAAMTTGLTALSVRGLIPEMSTGRNIAIHTVNGVDYAVPVGQSVQGRAVDSSRAGLDSGDPAGAPGRRSSHLETIRTQIPGAPGEALADVELMALRPSAEGNLQANAAGELSRNGTQWRSLRELAEQVTAANNVATAHGMNRQYAIRIHPPGPDGHSPVQVIGEARPPGATAPDAVVADAIVRQYLASQTGRTAASHDAVVRLRTLDPLSTVEIRPDGRLRLNNQIDLDAARVGDIRSGSRGGGAPVTDTPRPAADVAAAAAMGEQDLRTLLHATRELERRGGDIRRLRADLPPLAEALDRLASSPTYRLRMPYHAGEGRAWATGLVLDDAHRAQMDALVTAADEPQLVRMFDIPNEGTPRGTANLPETQGFFATWALDRNPRDVGHFVSLYQFIRGEFIRRTTNLELQARDLMASESISLETARSRLGYGNTRGGQPVNVDEFVWGQLRSPAGQTEATTRWNEGVRARTAGMAGGGVQVGLGATDAETIGRIREHWPIPMHDPETATYHVNKHHHELPRGEQFDPANPRTGVGSDWDAYMESARLTIANGARPVSVAASQDGLGRVFTFERQLPAAAGRTRQPPVSRALVLVSHDGTATLLTYIPGKGR